MTGSINADRNIRLLEIYTSSLGLMFCIGVIVPYYRDEIGLSFQDFMIGETVFAAVTVALEVPTGWISDVWKRKHVLALAAAFEMFGFMVLLAADNLWMAVAAQGILGIAVSLFSGSNSALLYDTLLEAGREGEFRKREGRRQAISLYSIAVAATIGAFLYEFNHYLPVILTLIGVTPAFFCAMLMQEPRRHKRAVERNPLADMAATFTYALRGHAEVGFIILFAAALFSATKSIMWTQQPYYMALGIPEGYFGALMAVGWAVGGMSCHLAHVLDGKVSNLRFLSCALGAAVLICVAASVGPGLHGVVLLMLGGSCLYGLANPRVSDAINRRVGSERRATILSTQNLLAQLLFVPLGLGLGALTEAGGVSLALQGLAGWLAMAGVFLALWAAWRRGRTA